MEQAIRLFLIKQVMMLSKEVNCDCNTQDFKEYDTETIKKIYRKMSKQASILNQIGGV